MSGQQQARPAPGGILGRILDEKRREVAAARQRLPLAQLQRQAEATGDPTRGFRRTLAAGGLGEVRVIAEIKKASPSKGVIRPDFDPVAIARSYQAGGAAAISVLTDTPFFQGSLAFLEAVRGGVELPLLRKDFLLDPYQVYEARTHGADAVLLIVAALSVADLRELRQLAEFLGMDALVEVHTRAELETALASGASLIGVNNRDLTTFHTTLDVTVDLAAYAPPGCLLVSESGIGSRADLDRLLSVGVRAVLVGESLMRAADPGAGLRRLLGTAAGGVGAP